MAKNFKPSWYKLVGGFNPSENSSSNWISSASFGVKIKKTWNHQLLNCAYWHFFSKKTQRSKKNIHNKISSENHRCGYHLSVLFSRRFPKIQPQANDAVIPTRWTSNRGNGTVTCRTETWSKIPQNREFSRKMHLTNGCLEDEIGPFSKAKLLNFSKVQDWRLGQNFAKANPPISAHNQGFDLVGGWITHFKLEDPAGKPKSLMLHGWVGYISRWFFHLKNMRQIGQVAHL